MKRFHKNKEISKFNKFRLLIKTLYFLVFILCALQIVVSNSLTTSGEKISKLYQETEKLRLENKILEENKAKLNSIFVLTALAEEKGFVKSTTTMVLSPMIPVAIKLN